jgi:hypothetical protein
VDRDLPVDVTSHDSLPPTVTQLPWVRDNPAAGTTPAGGCGRLF